jgi:hypothetical protein
MTLHRMLPPMLAVVVSAWCFGCSSDPTTQSIAASLRGQWAVQQTVPGSSFSTVLTPSGDSLTGLGEFVVEAGGSGFSTARGNVEGDAVNLDFTLMQEFPGGGVQTFEHFAGHLSMGKLTGTMQVVDRRGLPPVPIVFVRQP